MKHENPWYPTNNELLVLWCLREEGRTEGTPARMTATEIARRSNVNRSTVINVLERLERRHSWIYRSGSEPKSGNHVLTYSLTRSKLDAIDATLQEHHNLVQALWSGRELDNKARVANPPTPATSTQGPKENHELRRFQRLKYRLASDAPMELIDADEFLFALAYGPEENPSGPMQSLFEPHMQDALVQLMHQASSPRERGAALRILINEFRK